MRLVGISLLALLLVGAVVALSLMDGRGLATAALRHVSEPATLRFEVPTGIALEETADASHRAAFHFNQTRPVILSGLPSYQSIRFPLPRDVQVLSGRLRVVLTAQAIAGAEAALRVQIGGSRRGEMLLKTGVHRSDFEIVLTPEDLVGDAIKVSFSLVGRGPTGPCDAAAAMATSVEIEPETALDLTLTGPLETARDRVASWGGIARIGWPEWLKPEEQVRRLALSTDLLRDGADIAFWTQGGADALNTAAMRDLLADLPLGIEARSGSSLEGALSSANAGVRRFTRQARWRIGVGLAQVPTGQVPAGFDLSLALGPTALGQNWTIDVTLNGRLVHAEAVPANQRTYRADIDLPDHALGQRATLEITATSAPLAKPICAEGPELLAEMLDDTRITFRPDQSSALSQMHRALAEVTELGLVVDGRMTAARAYAVARSLAAALPSSIRLRPAKSRDTAVPMLTVTAPSKGDTHAAVHWRIVPGSYGRFELLCPGAPTPATAPIVIELALPDAEAAQ